MRFILSIICMFLTATLCCLCHIFAFLSWISSSNNKLFVFLSIISFLFGLFFLIVELFYIGSEPLGGSQQEKRVKKASEYHFRRKRS